MRPFSFLQEKDTIFCRSARMVLPAEETMALDGQGWSNTHEKFVVFALPGTFFWPVSRCLIF